MRILLVEDDNLIGDGIEAALKHQGFSVDWFTDGPTAHNALSSANYDAAVLDLTLPGMDGLEILQSWRKQGKAIPVLILTARTSIAQRVEGLNLGADDYLPKPFYLPELNARIKALIRRNNFGGVDTIVINEITLYPEERKVLINNAPVNLTAKEFDLLVYFIANKNRVVQKNALVEHLWGDNADQFDNFDFIYNHVKNLRKKLLAANCHDYLQSIYGIGNNFTTEL